MSLKYPFSITTLLLSTAVLASDDSQLADMQALVSKASQNRVKVEKTFEGPDDFTGIVMQHNGDRGIAWVTPDKKILMGVLIDETGKNYSQEAHANYIGTDIKPGAASNASLAIYQPASQSSALMESVSALKSVSLGDIESNRIIYVFGDLNCHYCEELYKIISKSKLDQQPIRIQWIPVAILSEKSLAQAAQLLLADNPQALLKAHHGNHQYIQSTVNEYDPRLPEIINNIKSSTEILSKLNNGTPAMVYWNGTESVILPGLPPLEDIKKAFDSVKPF